jgi:integrase
MESRTLREALCVWQRLAAVGKRPATQRYHTELVLIFTRRFPNVDTPVPAITPEQISDFLEAIAHYSAPRFNALLGVLKAVVPQTPPLRFRAVAPKEVHLPNQTEFAAILRELDNAHRGHSGLVARFLALSGLRIKEARRVRWLDVRDDCLLVPASITKNGKSRAVPMLPALAEVINRLRGVPPERETIVPQLSIRTALQFACRRAGVRRISHHDFRRLYATRCIESGVDVPTVARWVGHQDGGGLLARTYFHLIDSHSRDMARRVEIRV